VWVARSRGGAGCVGSAGGCTKGHSSPRRWVRRCGLVRCEAAREPARCRTVCGRARTGGPRAEGGGATRVARRWSTGSRGVVHRDWASRMVRPLRSCCPARSGTTVPQASTGANSAGWGPAVLRDVSHEFRPADGAYRHGVPRPWLPTISARRHERYPDFMEEPGHEGAATDLSWCGPGSSVLLHAASPTAGSDRTARTSAAPRRGTAPRRVWPVSARSPSHVGPSRS